MGATVGLYYTKIYSHWLLNETTSSNMLRYHSVASARYHLCELAKLAMMLICHATATTRNTKMPNYGVYSDNYFSAIRYVPANDLYLASSACVQLVRPVLLHDIENPFNNIVALRQHIPRIQHFWRQYV